eukprot:1154828-Pelagomonas_calceolata.AAC.5
MEPGASNNPPDPHNNLLFVAAWWRGFKALLSRCVPFSLIDAGRTSLPTCKKTGRHNIAGRMITEAVSKSPWGSGLVNTDKGSDDRLAHHNLLISYEVYTHLQPY